MGNFVWVRTTSPIRVIQLRSSVPYFSPCSSARRQGILQVGGHVGACKSKLWDAVMHATRPRHIPLQAKQTDPDSRYINMPITGPRQTVSVLEHLITLQSLGERNGQGSEPTQQKGKQTLRRPILRSREDGEVIPACVQLTSLIRPATSLFDVSVIIIN